MTPRKRSVLISSAAATLAALACLGLVNAQAPGAMRRMGFTQMDDKLFIQGGYDTSTSSEFYALDLATSWSDSAPAWTALRNGQSTAHLALTTISSEFNGGSKGSVLAIGGMDAPSFFSVYDITANTWSNITGVKAPYAELEGHAAISDPTSGLIYIVGGYSGKTYNTLTVYDPVAKTMDSRQSATLATSQIDIGAVWSTKRNSLLIFGGSKATPTNPEAISSTEVNEYDPVTKTWSVMETSGEKPPARLDHCMAASSDGSRIVVFAGTKDGEEFFKDIYILNVDNKKWKKGADAAVTRTRMSCAVHSAQFIAWGGSSGSSRNTMLDNIPIIYNMNSGKWVNAYDASMSLSSTNVGGIVGGILAVAVVGGLAAFFFYKKRKTRIENEAYQSDAKAAAAIGRIEVDENIKVLASSPQLQSNNPYYGYNTGNDYPMNKMESDMGTGAGYYNNNTVNNADAMMNSPMPSHYYPDQQQYHQHHQVQSPAATYQQGAYPTSTPAFSSATTNPFDDYQHYPSNSSGSHSPNSNPFSNSSVHLSPSGSDYYPPPSMTTPEMQRQHLHALTQDPFDSSTSSPPPSSSSIPPLQQAQAQVYPNYRAFAAANPGMSPSPGARAPQTIPEEGQAPLGYVPPPPTLS
ncbi:Leucine-zipper-like transcriptional regulator 1 [Podila humilis]|nr:Leucine-zipper-like transcriptional regulator 1 [Podila humilis]